MYNFNFPSAFLGYPITFNKYYPTQMYMPMYAYPEALNLISQSAPKDQKGIISSIIQDERKHLKMLSEIYWQVTGKDLPPAPEVSFEKPKSYCEGISTAIFGELAAVERYRRVLFGFEFLPYRNMITEIYTDELKHASKWNYLYALNCK